MEEKMVALNGFEEICFRVASSGLGDDCPVEWSLKSRWKFDEVQQVSLEISGSLEGWWNIFNLVKCD